MAKKKDYSQEYAQALKRFNRRIKEWVTKHHMYVEPPKLTGPPTAKDVRTLNKITLKNLTKSQVKEFQRNYDIAYDNNVEEVIDKPDNIFDSIPDENDLNVEASLNQNEVKYKTEPEDSEAGVMADLQYLLNGLIEHGRTQAPVWNSAEILSSKEMAIRNIYNDAINKVGNLKAYLAYLEDSDTHADLTDACDSVFRASTDKQLDDSLNSFAVVLNLGRPITNEQSYTLTTDNAIDFDYSDTDME